MHPLLASYLGQLSKRPLTTKAVTAAILSFFQEILATHLAGVPAKRLPRSAPTYAHVLAWAKIDIKAIKLAIYGFLISAPMGHILVGTLQKIFAGRTGTGAKVAQILASNLLVAPIQTSVYLASMAVVNGATSMDEVMRTVRGGFIRLIRVSWVTSPLAMVFAQKFLAPELWVPFFNLVAFALGTFFNTKIKAMQLRQERKANARKDFD